MDAQANTRTKRAQRILDSNGVTVRNLIDRTFDCQSERDPDALYRVNLKQNSCTCADATELTDANGNIIRPANVCKHLIAATLFERRIEESKQQPRCYKTYSELFATLAPTL